MPRHEMQYPSGEDKPGKLVEVHRTDLSAKSTVSVKDQLLAYFYKQAFDPQGKVPKVKEIQNAKVIQGDFNASHRDLAWSQYTLEIEVAQTAADDKEAGAE